MIFSKEYETLYHDMDASGAVSASHLLKYMQETAHLQLLPLGASAEDLRGRDKEAFWLTRLCIEIVKPLYAYDKIKAETWPSDDSRGFSFNRCFRVLRGEETVALAYSVWALMNLDEMRPVAVRDWNIGLELEPPVKPSAPIHCRLPKDLEYTPGGAYKVSYRDIDINGHMNNTNYPDVLCGFLPTQAIKGRGISELTLSYMHEAPEGSVIKGEYAEDPEESGTYYIRTYLKDSGLVNVESRIRLKNLSDF